jgi:hypothetical protein
MTRSNAKSKKCELVIRRITQANRPQEDIVVHRKIMLVYEGL